MRRTVWLTGSNLILVADQITGTGIEQIDYHWHGHPTAAWWVEENVARLVFSDTTLWLTSPSATLSARNLDRLSGSRGQLTLSASAALNIPTLWWIFSLDAPPPAVTLSSDFATLHIAEHCFKVQDVN